MNAAELRQAVDAALAGEWHGAHGNVQRGEDDAVACWIHAVLHKIEGDVWNSKYWYARTRHDFAEWSDPETELRAIRATIDA